MYYYDPNNRNPRRWATVATAVYALLLIGSFALVSFDFRQIHDKPGDTITIDFTEPPAPEPPKPRVRTATEPRVHDRTAPVEQTAQVSGKDETTQTPNPRALFNMNMAAPTNPTTRAIPALPKARTGPAAPVRDSIPTGWTSWIRACRGAGWWATCPNLRTPVRRAAR